MSQPVALSIALLITLCSAIAPIAHADEPAPFSKVCEEEHQGEVVRYESDPDTNGFSRRHADVCFTEDKTALFVELKDYKPNLNSCSWRTTLNKKDDGYYKKANECEVTMKFTEQQAITEFPKHCEQQCGYNAHFYSDTLTKQATLDPSKEKLTLLQNYSEICEPIMPEMSKMISDDGSMAFGVNSENYLPVRIKYNKYSSITGWVMDIDNNGTFELLNILNPNSPNSSANEKLHVLYEISGNEYFAISKFHNKEHIKTLTSIQNRVINKFSTTGNLTYLEQIALIKKPLTLLKGIYEKKVITTNYDMDVITFKNKQYVVIKEYPTIDKKTEINLLEILSLDGQYKNSCNYKVNLKA